MTKTVNRNRLSNEKNKAIKPNECYVSKGEAHIHVV